MDFLLSNIIFCSSYGDDNKLSLLKARPLKLIGLEWIKKWIFYYFWLIIGLEWINKWIKRD